MVFTSWTCYHASNIQFNLQNPSNERLLSPLEPLNREHRGNAKILEVLSDEETSVYGGHFGTVFILFAEICIDYLL